jgi:hypothetical protein
MKLVNDGFRKRIDCGREINYTLTLNATFIVSQANSLLFSKPTRSLSILMILESPPITLAMHMNLHNVI